MLIKMEVFAGENIESCFDQATNVARILNITVKFDFNGITCFCNSFGDKKKFVSSYHHALNADYKTIATS